MRILFLIFIVLFFTTCTCSNSTDSLLAEVFSKDQRVRQQMQELTKAVCVNGEIGLIDSLIIVNEKVALTDKHNMEIIDSILQHGIPKGLSAESYKTIWIVIDHASLEKQEQYITLIEKMSIEGLIESDKYAILFDRIAMKQNRPQRYGSQSVQFGSPDNMHLYIWPVENADKLDSLRASVKMNPISKYLRQLTENTGINAQYKPQITIEEINKMIASSKESSRKTQ